MKLSTPLTCILSIISLTSGSASSSRSLRGYDQNLIGPFDVLRCTLEGKTNEDACSTAVTVDGSPCSYCSVSSNGQTGGLCVDPQVATQMMQQNDSINCTNTELGNTGFDKEEFKCEIEAMNDAEKCAATKTVGEESCEFCSIDGPFGTQSFCFSPDHADKLKGVVGDKFSCVSHEETEPILEDVEGPFDVLKCTFEGKTNEDACSTAVAADGSPCSYCSISSNGNEAGLCVDPQVATQMMQQNDSVNCTNTELGNTGFDKEEFKCEIEAMNDAEKCAATTTVGEESCEFCSIDGPFGTQSFCFSPDHADKLKGVVGDKFSCVSHEETEPIVEDVERPFDALKCFLEARTNEDACSTAVAADGSPCSYCSMSSNGEEAGLCVDPHVATQMTEMNDSVTCTNTMLTGPITDCNIHGIDYDTCLDPSKVNGSQCVWCDAQIGGFCFPKEWEGIAGKFLSCEEPKEVEVDPEDEQLNIDPSFLSSSCFKVGLKGKSPDDCRAAIDDKTGENCIFCNAPRLGGIGLCMTPEFKGNEGQFYVCDKDVSIEIE